MEYLEEIQRTLGCADMVFITTGMGTGTGATLVVAQIERQIKAVDAKSA